MSQLHIVYGVPADPELFGENMLPEQARACAEHLARRMEEAIRAEYPDAEITTEVVGPDFAATRKVAPSRAWYSDHAGRRIESAEAVIAKLDGILAQNWEAWLKEAR
jgi:low affinity Fe/Cu permease